MSKKTLLERTDGYINGAWVGADSGDYIDVIDAATGERLARVPAMGAVETARAIEAARDSLLRFSSIEQRRQWLGEIARRLLSHKEALGEIITLEHGKPLAEGIAEVEYSAGFFRFFSESMGHLGPESLPQHPRNLNWTVHHRPAGVAALITPWNFPLAMLAKKLAPALAAGCGIVTKPASQTPLSAAALHGILHEVGVPPGVVNLVTGRSGPIGEVLCTHEAVRVISFTGSTEVGRLLAEKAAPHLKRLALELGGNAPFIVFDDADLDKAAAELIANKFRSGGQTCVCTNRVYVQDGVAEAFAKAVAEQTARLKVGNGMADGTDIGPLINRDGFDKVAEHVADALRHGAKRLVGNDPPRPDTEWGAYYPPTVLVDVRPGMLVCREETFGPVVAISRFTDEAAAIEMANDTPYGLAAYVFTADVTRGERVIRQLHFGHVGLNSGTGPAPEAPFGGMKLSGFGREGGIEGLMEFCETQVVAAR